MNEQTEEKDDADEGPALTWAQQDGAAARRVATSAPRGAGGARACVVGSLRVHEAALDRLELWSKVADSAAGIGKARLWLESAAPEDDPESTPEESKARLDAQVHVGAGVTTA